VPIHGDLDCLEFQAHQHRDGLFMLDPADHRQALLMQVLLEEAVGGFR
jgi:hypothetical protein